MVNRNSNADIFLLTGIFGVLYWAYWTQGTFLELPIIIEKDSSMTLNSVQLQKD